MLLCNSASCSKTLLWDALELLGSQFHGTLVKVEFVGLVYQIMDISVFLICRHIFAIVDILRENVSLARSICFDL